MQEPAIQKITLVFKFNFHFLLWIIVSYYTNDYTHLLRVLAMNTTKITLPFIINVIYFMTAIFLFNNSHFSKWKTFSTLLFWLWEVGLNNANCLFFLKLKMFEINDINFEVSFFSIFIVTEKLNLSQLTK